MSTIEYPMAEIFTSIHGEGAYAGTPMTFFRFAGCTVGKYIPPNGTGEPLMPILSTGHQAWRCQTFDGRYFPCDTDFNLWKKCTLAELVDSMPKHIRHVCITGGEPLMHQRFFYPLIQELWDRDVKAHIETSGTIMPDFGWYAPEQCYIACAPKYGYHEAFIQNFADEIRVLVDPLMDMSNVLTDCTRWAQMMKPIYFAPISSKEDVDKLDPNSMQLAVELAHRFPGSRVSVQIHKVLGVR